MADECPKCPPAGAPLWLATFADLMSLLMCFFVLLLSFATMDIAKFKQLAHSVDIDDLSDFQLAEFFLSFHKSQSDQDPAY